jgi:RimJ/RimL family protein N-acetyltransferase
LAIFKPISIETKIGEMIIESPNLADAKEIIEFLKVVQGETDFLAKGKDNVFITKKQEEKFINSINQSHKSLFLVVRCKDKIVATLTITSDKTPRTSHKAEFGMAVLKKYWGLGIGTNLINLMLEFAKKVGLVRIELKVDADNARAINLYKKFDFKIEGKLESYKRINEDDLKDGLIMAKILKY